MAADRVCFDLTEGFQHWSNVREREITEADHISDNQLLVLSGVEGLKGVSSAIISHLSTCPRCLGRWVKSSKEQKEHEASQQSSDDYLVYGGLEAAASLDTIEPIQLKSSCGRFSLGVLPGSGDPANSLITLEVQSDTASLLEEKVLTVREKNGTIILSGSLRGGRLGGTFSDIRKVNLSTWTLQIK
jgi:hypothetical protein